jgi:hypothetical protein
MLVSAAGCDDSQTLTASGFIDRINAEGVAIELGRQLSTSGGAEELYAVRVPPLPGEPKPVPGSEGEPGASGSLYVFEDSGGAEEQLAACQASAGLLCYRASNIVVVLDEESSLWRHSAWGWRSNVCAAKTPTRSPGRAGRARSR